MTSSENALLRRSPLDLLSVTNAQQAANFAAVIEPVASGFKPSRFNVQATTEDGWLLLWNTYTSSMNAFRPEKREQILGLLDQKGFDGTSEGIVAYLNQRGYLVPRDADELRRVRYEFGKENHRSDRLELIILPSEDCNFRCTYCYEMFRRGTMKPEVCQSIKKLVESRASSLREMTVGWFGGEPLYGLEAIEELAPFLADIAQREGIDYFSHITTNAYLLTNEVVDKLLSWRITDYQITLDGLPEDHDRHRPTRDGGSTFQTIYDNLADMAARDDEFSVVIRVNFDRTNAPGLHKFLELLQAKFSNDDRFTISFHTVGKWGGANDAILDVCGRTEAQNVRMKMKAAARSLGLRVTSGWRPSAGGLGAQVCYAVRPYNFIIGAHGDLMKCTIDLDNFDRNRVGKLLPDGTLVLDVDKMALWTEPAFERDTGCQSCHMLAACQGVHCPKIRMDTGQAPCPEIRRTAKQEMLDYFSAKQSRTIRRRRPRDEPFAIDEAIN